jgi:hypothetical protein
MSCRVNIILDLDNTLIHTISTLDLKKIPPQSQAKFRRQRWKQEEQLMTFERPHLQQFLTYLFSNFNVGVYTMGTKEYAKEIVDRFVLCVPGRRLDFILHRGNFIESSKMFPGTFKDLRYIWNVIRPYGYYKYNTFIIDDNLYVQETNRQNTLCIEPFDLFRGNKYNAYAPVDTALVTCMKILKVLKRLYYTNECAIHSNNKNQCQKVYTEVSKNLPKIIHCSGVFSV